MKYSFISLSLSLCYVLFTACESPIQTMQDMKNTTADMKETTKDMSETTQQMSEKMDQTNKNTSNLAAASRHGFSEEKRYQKRKELYPDGDIGNDLTDAKIFYLALEFQIWDGVADEYGLSIREELIGDALDEMYRSLIVTYSQLKQDKFYDLIPYTSRLEKMSPLNLEGEDKQAERSFYANAATFHFKDLLQHRTIKQNKELGYELEEVSLYDVIESALIKESRGEELNINEQKVVVRSFRGMLIDLLRARVDFLSALAINEFVDKGNMSLKDKFAGLVFKVTGGNAGELRPKSVFASANDPTREKVLEYMDGAVKAKRILNKIGESIQLQKEIRSILENVEIEEQDSDQIKDLDLLSDTNRLIELKNELLGK
ncbi:MAG: hypothetical protein QF441_12185 [Bacteriovoracaceae bacterium]|nr:hypothetical protein [Halobacteriovoraceae bacterium]MDP7321364.1 hypothetical protein [Bacteriovoracaceae bacterium]